MDQLVTWRELGYNFCKYRPDYNQYSSLPEWAIETLHQHAEDERSYVYGREILRQARTHDTLWNAAQRQLLREGVIQNYLRMLWGKNILAWSSSSKLALAAMLELNDRYALDGRDPNSISGIFWVLGRFDHPWTERPVFGKVRYMTSANTRRKLRLTEYLARYKGKGRHEPAAQRNGAAALHHPGVARRGRGHQGRALPLRGGGDPLVSARGGWPSSIPPHVP